MAAGGFDVAVPAHVARLQAALNGEQGEAWAADIPRLVGEFAERWVLRDVGPAFTRATASFVAPAVSEEGEPVVVKISFIDRASRRSAEALRAWGGRGAVSVIATEPDLGAMMLERLEPGVTLRDHPDRDEAVSIGCALLRGLWQAPRADHRLDRVADLAGAWALDLPQRWTALDEPCPRDLVDAASSLCRMLETPDRPQVITHGDFRLESVLSARRAPWLAIAPKPLAGEPAFDAGRFVRSLLDEDVPADGASSLIRRVAHALGVDADRVRTWAFVQAVADALTQVASGLGDGSEAIQIAEALT